MPSVASPESYGKFARWNHCGVIILHDPAASAKRPRAAGTEKDKLKKVKRNEIE